MFGFCAKNKFFFFFFFFLYPDHNRNLISWCYSYITPLQNSLNFVHNFLSYPADRQSETRSSADDDKPARRF